MTSLRNKQREAPLPTEDLFHKKLAGSGISKDTAKKLGLRAMPEPPFETKAPALAGFEIPYFDLQGKKTDFSRYRYLVDTRTSIEKLTVKKPLRYIQPKASPVRAYFPPLVDWVDVAGRPEIPIIVTEGELKAACACLHGTPTVGLGGVFSFRSKQSRELLLPELQEITLENRVVYIIYDSDAITNKDVVLAENRLADTLLGHRALPFICRIPAAGGAKIGLDDYLVQGGALEDLFEDAQEFSETRPLAKFNEKFVLVQSPLAVCEIDNIEKKMDPGKFMAYHYGHISHIKTLLDGKGNARQVPIKTAKEWLQWPGRREAERVVYCPGEGRFTEDGNLNDWTGWGVEPLEGDVSLWNEFMDYMFKNANPDHRTWFERWLAYPIQNPGAKMLSACVFWGVTQGTGKSMVGEIMSKIYGHNAVKLDNSSLEDSRNEWSVNKQFAFGDEITGSDRRSTADRLKGLITQTSIRVNIKFIPSYAIDDHINYYFTSNHPDAFYLDDGDRRWFIHEVTGPKYHEDFYNRFHDWWHDGHGAAHIFHHLLTLDMGDFSPTRPPPLTEAKLNMISVGRSELAEWVNLLKNDPDSVLMVGTTPVKRRLMTAKDLLAFYDPDGRGKATSNGMSRELKRQGFVMVNNGLPFRGANGEQKRFWIIRPSELPGGVNSNMELMRVLDEDSKRASQKKTLGGAK